MDFYVVNGQKLKSLGYLVVADGKFNGRQETIYQMFCFVTQSGYIVAISGSLSSSGRLDKFNLFVDRPDLSIETLGPWVSLIQLRRC